jgi:hypothetical protein
LLNQTLACSGRRRCVRVCQAERERYHDVGRRYSRWRRDTGGAERSTRDDSKQTSSCFVAAAQQQGTRCGWIGRAGQCLEGDIGGKSERGRSPALLGELHSTHWLDSAGRHFSSGWGSSRADAGTLLGRFSSAERRAPGGGGMGGDGEETRWSPAPLLCRRRGSSTYTGWPAACSWWWWWWW